ncbi:hypothetical protein, partial [Paracoccus aestuarii]|uniref:hypothetical protein n=1 Tax=Paracoccus aestuarii TaxID=453842 RepID=UPI00197D562A
RPPCTDIDRIIPALPPCIICIYQERSRRKVTAIPRSPPFGRRFSAFGDFDSFLFWPYHLSSPRGELLKGGPWCQKKS